MVSEFWALGINQDIGQTEFLCGDSREQSTSKFIQIVERIQFLFIVKTEVPISFLAVDWAGGRQS